MLYIQDIITYDFFFFSTPIPYSIIQHAFSETYRIGYAIGVCTRKSHAMDERTKNKNNFFAPPWYVVFFIVCDVSFGQIVKSGFISIFCRQTYLALIVDVHIYIYIYIRTLGRFPVHTQRC